MEKFWEIAYRDENGETVRGGIKASRSTVGRWIHANEKADPGVEYFAVPADENAITAAEYAIECGEWAAGNLDYAYR